MASVEHRLAYMGPVGALARGQRPQSLFAYDWFRVIVQDLLDLSVKCNTIYQYKKYNTNHKI